MKNSNGKFEFIFQKVLRKWLQILEKLNHNYFTSSQTVKKQNSYDWTIYYLRKKLFPKNREGRISLILLNFNQKRGYYQLVGKMMKNNIKSIVLS